MRTWIRRSGMALGALAVAGALVGVACGGDDEESAPATATTPADGVATIDQDNLAFSPTELTVAVGQMVRFTNSEAALHTVTIDGENLSGNMREGDVFEWTPEEAGTYRVTCDYHPQMQATITVQ